LLASHVRPRARTPGLEPPWGRSWIADPWAESSVLVLLTLDTSTTNLEHTSRDADADRHGHAPEPGEWYPCRESTTRGSRIL
jgi:hypothetical protein